MSLGLHESAHDAKDSFEGGVPSDEAGDDGVVGAFVGLEHVGGGGEEGEAAAAVLEDYACAFRDYT